MAAIAAQHEEVLVREGRRTGLTMAIAVHRTVAGRSLGGCRVWSYPAPEDALRDVERLARAMTFKAAAAGLRLGGGKGVIAVPPGESLTGERRQAALQDFAELIDELDGRYVSAQDVGLSAGDVAYLASLTPHVVGTPPQSGGAGDPSPYTAWGVEVAIRAALDHQPLDGRTVVVLGLGHVGGDLARRLANAGARLVVSDIDERRRALADELGAHWVDPDHALDQPGDVFAPCALGGVIDAKAIERLNTAVVAGAANNQLADERLATALHERGIRWAPDFIANAGGLIAVADELHGFNRERVEHGVLAIGATLAEVFTRAEAAHTDTLTAAMEVAAERLS